jgi:hypothetical protein
MRLLLFPLYAFMAWTGKTLSLLYQVPIAFTYEVLNVLNLMAHVI